MTCVESLAVALLGSSAQLEGLAARVPVDWRIFGGCHLDDDVVHGQNGDTHFDEGNSSLSLESGKYIDAPSATALDERRLPWPHSAQSRELTREIVEAIAQLRRGGPTPNMASYNVQVKTLDAASAVAHHAAILPLQPDSVAVLNRLVIALRALDGQATAARLLKIAVARGVLDNEEQRPENAFRRNMRATPWWDPSAPDFSALRRAVESAAAAMKDEVLRDLARLEGAEELWKHNDLWRPRVVHVPASVTAGVASSANNASERKHRAASLENGRLILGGHWDYQSEGIHDEGHWSELVLVGVGKPTPAAQEFPRTMDALRFAGDPVEGQGLLNAKFSIMHPGTHVLPHVGLSNYKLRAHVCLVGCGPKTRLRVAGETRVWPEGKMILFDDSFEHEVWHDGKEARIVMIMDVFHPELPVSMRRAVVEGRA
jgi:hypothetical protein